MLALDNRAMSSGWHWAPYFRRYIRELVSKPAISIKKIVGGAPIERLGHPILHIMSCQIRRIEISFDVIAGLLSIVLFSLASGLASTFFAFVFCTTCAQHLSHHWMWFRRTRAMLSISTIISRTGVF